MHEILQVVLYLVVLIVLAPFLGNYLFKVFADKPFRLKSLVGKIEQRIYKALGVDSTVEQTWKAYAVALLVFNLLGFLLLFLILVFQQYLPLNPENLPGLKWHLALNVSVSFVTNTNWQSYGGENTLSYFSQMLGLTVQNFLSAATGVAVLLALIRGIARKNAHGLGNFWVDITKTTLYVFLPLSILMAVVLMGQGVIQNFHSYYTFDTLQGQSQTLPMGPAASQIAIKQLGTNGGGFFNANSAHPFENPTPLSNFLQMLAILIVPAALTFTYGKMLGSLRHGLTLFAVMFVLLTAGILISLYAENDVISVFQGLANYEGKEFRFGTGNSVLWSTITTAASNGSVNTMHDSLSPFAGMVALLNILFGEVVFGGVGAGLYGMVVFVIITVFIAGLMVGRTPEYLGKKIESFEIQMAMIAVLAPSIAILSFSAWAAQSSFGLPSLNNHGPHGLSELLYAFASAAGNNGSAFAGLNANTVFYNVLLAIAMLIGRFGVILPVLALAGNLVSKKTTPASLGTFRTDNFLFASLLLMIILIVGGLTFFPTLALGPIVEHVGINEGVLF